MKWAEYTNLRWRSSEQGTHQLHRMITRSGYTGRRTIQFRPQEEPIIRRTFCLFILVVGLVVAAQAQSLQPATPVVQVSSVLSFDVVHPGSSFQVAVIAVIAPGWHINTNPPTSDYLIPTELRATPPEGVSLGDIIYPEGEMRRLQFAEDELGVYDGIAIIRFPVTLSKTVSIGEGTIDAVLEYQACDDLTCLAPEELNIMIPFQVVGLDRPSVPVNPEIFPAAERALVSQEEATPVVSPGGELITKLITERGWLVALLSIFVLGLALNLTPCAYPMIPIVIGYFSQQGEGRTRRVLGLALVYLLGMALTYSVLGVVAALTGSMFGVLLQNRWVLAGIAAIMIVLALSLFGLYPIRPPRFLTRRLPGMSTGGALGALSMGLFSGIVASPCVAPITIGLLTYVGVSGDPWRGFWMFFTLALGLGSPYVVVALFAGSLWRLPKFGGWLTVVERVFGFALIGLAVYFLTPLLPAFIVSWLFFALAVAAGLYIGWLGRLPMQGRISSLSKKIIALACIGVGIYVMVPKPALPSADWQTYDSVLLEQAQEERQPAIVDFYADWCLPCLELDRNTFSDKRVIEAMEPFLLLKADVSQYHSEDVEAMRERFAVKGVPTILFLDPYGEEIPETRIVGFVPPDEFLEIIGRATASGQD